MTGVVIPFPRPMGEQSRPQMNRGGRAALNPDDTVVDTTGKHPGLGLVVALDHAKSTGSLCRVLVDFGGFRTWKRPDMLRRVMPAWGRK